MAPGPVPPKLHRIILRPSPTQPTSSYGVMGASSGCRSVIIIHPIDTVHLFESGPTIEG